MSFERVPPVTLESDAAVNELYDYFEPRDSDSRLTAVAFPLLAMIYAPRLVYPKGVGELITDHMEHGGQIALALDHTYGDDHVKWGGATWRGPLHRMWRHSDIMAKPVLLDEHPALSLLLANVGVIPVIRSQDVANPRFGGVEKWGDKPSQEIWQRHELATRRAIQTGTIHLNRGNSHGSHVGGRRRDPDNPTPIPTKSIKPGLFEMILDADDPDNIMLLAGALHKGGRYFRRSVMALSGPIEHQATAEEFKEPIAVAMQQCREVAELIASNQRPAVIRPLTKPILDMALKALKSAKT